MQNTLSFLVAYQYEYLWDHQISVNNCFKNQTFNYQQKITLFLEKENIFFRSLFDLFLTFIIHTAMYHDEHDDPFKEDDFNLNQESADEYWSKMQEGEDIPERIEWLEEIDSGELDEYSFENDLDDFDFDDI